MNNEDKLSVLRIEKVRLRNMVDEVKDSSRYSWGVHICSVCNTAKQILGDDFYGDFRCSICVTLATKSRCDYLDGCVEDNLVFIYSVKDTDYIFDEKSVEYLVSLFENYIMQIDDERAILYSHYG